MTRKSTRSSSTASKAEPKQPEPTKAMDPSVREQATPEIPRTNQRDCYAALTLIAEVTSLFPETTYETSNINAFNTRLDVMFDAQDQPDLYPLLALVESDERVSDVLLDSGHEEGAVLVSFHSNFRTQDSREPFGLAEAHAILTGGGDIGLDENDDFVLAELWAENDARLTDEHSGPGA